MSSCITQRIFNDPKNLKTFEGLFTKACEGGNLLMTKHISKILSTTTRATPINHLILKNTHYNPIHVAAANNHPNIIEYLITHHYSDWSVKTVKAVSYTHLTLPTNREV
eukprot:TRINITY_DN13190_c0_g1_i1.p1 TRINITY_DN13190_c0_g1~~TRINITY_DN13190_c0_g1_i1.p1  ORF type:complete len:109 (+),score=9.26 TRINITY_DN13190_c0_g1_i1:227-553(+)